MWISTQRHSLIGVYSKIKDVYDMLCCYQTSASLLKVRKYLSNHCYISLPVCVKEEFFKILCIIIKKINKNLDIYFNHYENKFKMIK